MMITTTTTMKLKSKHIKAHSSNNVVKMLTASTVAQIGRGTALMTAL